MGLYTWAHIYTNKYTAIILASIFRQLFVPWRLLHFSCSPIKLCLVWLAPRDRNGTLSEMQCHRMLCWKFICFHQCWSFVVLLGSALSAKFLPGCPDGSVGICVFWLLCLWGFLCSIIVWILGLGPVDPLILSVHYDIWVIVYSCLFKMIQRSSGMVECLKGWIVGYVELDECVGIIHVVVILCK